MEIWSHRGRASPNELGNSSNNFMASHHLGVTGVEKDVSLTADERIIIYHPGSTYPDLTKMTWRDIEDSIFDVMTLSGFLNLMRSYREILCCLDLKHNSKKLVEEIVWEIGYRGLEERVFLTAFQQKIRIPFISTESNAHLLLQAKRIDNRIKTHLIANWPINLPKLAEQYHPDMISFGWLQEPRPMRIVSRNLFKLLVTTRHFRDDIKKVKGMGIKVLGGIVNDIDSMRYLADLGVDGLMTDNATLGMTFKDKLIKANCKL